MEGSIVSGAKAQASLTSGSVHMQKGGSHEVFIDGWVGGWEREGRMDTVSKERALALQTP